MEEILPRNKYCQVEWMFDSRPFHQAIISLKFGRGFETPEGLRLTTSAAADFIKVWSYFTPDVKNALKVFTHATPIR